MKRPRITRQAVKRLLIRGLSYVLVVLASSCAVVIVILLVTSSPSRLAANISAGSAVAIALLTAAYVITTARQLAAMQDQLREMKRSREIAAQPLPLADITEVCIERPRAFFSPPSVCVGVSRMRVRCRMRNHGTSPAVCVHVCACMRVGKGGTGTEFKSAASFINTLSASQAIEEDGVQEVSFLFSGDDEARVLDGLRATRIEDLPQLQLCTAYKDVLGGAFCCRQRHRLLISKEEQDEALKSWYSLVSSFRSVHKNELAHLERLGDPRGEDWDRVFQRLKHAFDQRVEGDDIKIRWQLLPEHFSVEPVSDEEYTDVLHHSGYGQAVPLHGMPCIDR